MTNTFLSRNSNKKSLPVGLLIIALAYTPLTLAMRGCCSWHGGVAACDSHIGRLICRDSTYSPTCTCPIYYGKNTQTNITQNNNTLSIGYFYNSCLSPATQYDQGYCEGAFDKRFSTFNSFIKNQGEEFWNCYNMNSGVLNTIHQAMKIITERYYSSSNPYSAYPFTAKIYSYLKTHPELTTQPDNQKLFNQIMLSIYPIPEQCKKLLQHHLIQ